MSTSTHALTQNLATWFESLSPQSLGQIEQFYEAEAYFKDPFNEVRDVARIQLIFQDMFTEFEQPRFVIQEQICDDDKRQSVLTWHFLFNWRGKAWCIVGSSHLRFGSTGLVIYHRDYWDASEELYEKLPVIGFVLKALKKRAQK
ncbi:nuclear transport factor 2 family protein [Perlucidibaca aquatica]|jgi:steroid delta-isomerase|uniref:nuclear transport factor 2 family protein n=1 Tax=Perlucidibaca aquatica TaxID=1852776 RepID=UPI00083B78F7|nr:nuclear transport factor 2 family protein [Perlucidibaca aquatica]